MSWFIRWPLLALVPALVLLVLYRFSRRRPALWAAAAWLLYLPYELAMRWRLLCSGECNIRVDLLLLYPALVMLTMVGIVTGLRGRTKS